MTKQQHIKVHEELHRSLDQLIGDFIMLNKGKRLSNTSVLELLDWSYAQTLEPELQPGQRYDLEVTP